MRLSHHAPLQLLSVSKRYPKVAAVREVTLSLAAGETLALIGPSGCGKSTLLRLIAGLEPVSSGNITLGGTDITHQSAKARGFGMVFQDYALFPHLNVLQNVMFGLAQRPPAERRRRALAMLERVALPHYADRRIFELSGGEQQRVALARALAPEPPLLLLDEPLSNLDHNLRESLKQALAELLGQLGVRAIYVTHDQSEAFALAQRVAVMRQGALEQLAHKTTLYSQPRTLWIARFLGHQNVYTAAQLIQSPVKGPALLRSDLIRIGEGATLATVRAHEVLGETQLLTLWVDSWQLTLRWRGFARELPAALRVGETVRLAVPEAAWVPLAADDLAE
jgi:ABC-type Fe3+/spermidine/putrescine transport system ATPase subunit